MGRIQVVKSIAREILDSRGNPTLEVSVYLNDGSVGTASVPSGASTGSYEAYEKRDTDDKTRFNGKGVREAVYNVNKVISPAISGIGAYDRDELDYTLITLDGTINKEHLGANAILGTSIAAARAAAVSLGMPLYSYLGGAFSYKMPIPMMNIINGGAHAHNNLDIQEFMIVPVGAENFAEAMRIGSEIYHKLGGYLNDRGHSTAVGDEGGYAPNLKDEREALDIICEAIEGAGYDTDVVKIAIDAAANEWMAGEGYILPKNGTRKTLKDMIILWNDLAGEYPLISIEDGLSENDFDGWRKLTQKLGDRLMLVGDDLFVTNTKRLSEGVKGGYGNAILIKPNQIGTLTETFDVIAYARKSGYKYIISHRSGETDDTTISDIAVASGADFIKAGAPCRGERIAKYNRLMKIESSMPRSASYGI